MTPAGREAVSIDGRDLRSLTLDSLRRNVGMVFEESFLFSSSVRDNIAFARPEASQTEIRARGSSRLRSRFHPRAAARLRQPGRASAA